MDNVTRIYNGEEFKKNCPNCGMAIQGEKCEYCGTQFIDFACIDTKKPFYLKIKQDDRIFVVKARLGEITYRVDPTQICYFDNIPHVLSVDRELNMNFLVSEVDKSTI